MCKIILRPAIISNPACLIILQVVAFLRPNSTTTWNVNGSDSSVNINVIKVRLCNIIQNAEEVVKNVEHCVIVCQ